MDCERKIEFDHNGSTTPYKIQVNNCKLVDLVIRIELNSSNINDTMFKIVEKFAHSFSNVFIFGNMFPESQGFVAMTITSCIKDTCSNLSLSN